MGSVGAEGRSADAAPLSVAVPEPARAGVSGRAALGLLEQLARQTTIAKGRIVEMVSLKCADMLYDRLSTLAAARCATLQQISSDRRVDSRDPLFRRPRDRSCGQHR